ncbi:MAG: HAD family phosphatase [Actinomycetia bacterium]|nr:HAD family phosphatase [Actinomycetes bacterium]
MKNKLLVFDLDGTILNQQHLLEPSMKDVLSRIKNKGFMFTIATGRVYNSALPFLNELDIDLPVIVCNGAILIDRSSTYFHYKLDKIKALEVLKNISLEKADKYIFYGSEIFSENGSSFSFSYSEILKIRISQVPSIEGLIKERDDDPTMFVFMMDKEIVPEKTEEIQNLGISGINVTNSNPYFVDVLSSRASKGHALKKMIKLLKINREDVIVVGDGLNDLEMFREAGLCVTVSNASPEVKKCADYISTKERFEGVIDFLKKEILK